MESRLSRQVPTPSLQAVSIGPEAASLQSEQGQGQVLAVLSSAIYLESLTGYVVALVEEDAPDGPLAVRVRKRKFPALLQRLHEHEGLEFHATHNGLDLADIVRLDWNSAAPWQPTTPRVMGSIDTRTAAARSLSVLVAQHVQQDGSGPVASCLEAVLSGRAPSFEALPVAGRLASSLSLFAAAVRRNDWSSAAQALTTMFGVGPGLTPSGDDVAGGLLATLCWQGVMLDGMLPDLHREASRRTNKISARLLWHAARGDLYAPAMQLGEALLAEQQGDIAGHAARLFAIGSTSGADTALGMAAGCLLGTRLNHKPAL
jgi:hypothetical protein